MTRSDQIRLALLKAAGSALRLLGFPGIELLGNGVGHLIWYFVPSRRRLAVRNIMRHLGMMEKDAEKRPMPASAIRAAPFWKFCLPDASA